MNGFVKVSNSIFEYKLSPRALFVYTYLSSRMSCLQTTTVKYDTISAACNIDVKTVRSAVKELECHNLVTKQNRFNSRGYLSNRYYLTNLIKDNKNWFKLDREIFQSSIKPTDFMVYCFVICKMSETDKQAFPSLTKICDGTDISRGRVAKAIQYLRSYTFLNRIRRHYKRTRAYRHNRYIHFTCNLKKGKRKARTAQVRTNQNQFSCIVHYLKANCKPFLRIRGSTHFP